MPPARLVSQAWSTVPRAETFSPNAQRQGELSCFWLFAPWSLLTSPFPACPSGRQQCHSRRPLLPPTTSCWSIPPLLIRAIWPPACWRLSWRQLPVCRARAAGHGLAGTHRAYGGTESLLSLVIFGRLMYRLNGSETPLVISNRTHLSLGWKCFTPRRWIKTKCCQRMQSYKQAHCGCWQSSGNLLEVNGGLGEYGSFWSKCIWVWLLGPPLEQTWPGDVQVQAWSLGYTIHLILCSSSGSAFPELQKTSCRLKF